MRQLLPLPVDDVDLDEVYAVARTRPWVRANMVASADGAAQVAGRSAGLSGPADKRLFSVLRGLADVILVGASTVRTEGYGPARPNAARQARRREQGLAQVPPIAVVSASLDLDPASPFFTEAVVRPLVLTVEAAPEQRRRRLGEVAEVLVLGARRVDVGAALHTLHGRGLTVVLTEGGPALLTEIVAAGRLDELSLTVAPLLLAGPATRVLAGPPLASAVPLRLATLLEDDGFLFARYRRDG